VLFAISYLIFTYLISSIPFGVVLSVIVADADPRDGGSGNTGATNVYRQHGARLGLLTFLLDALKGLLPTLLAAQVSDSLAFAGLVALTTIIGHCYSGYLRFRGGKGVATAAGAVLALHPLLMMLLVLVWGVAVALTRRSSIGALSAAVALPLLSALLAPAMLWVAAGVSILIFIRHTDNIQRILHGESTRAADRPVP
jgi:glycerol-3-phosphate acyltransferase PlsY